MDTNLTELLLPVTLEQVLQTKEERAAVQAELRSRYHAVIVSISVNMPGVVKRSPDVLALIEYALARLQDLLKAEEIQSFELRRLDAVAGPSAVLAVKGNAENLKKMAIRIEKEHLFARLLDIDVFDELGFQISRTSLGQERRGCFVCKKTALNCIRDRNHSKGDLTERVDAMLGKFRQYRAAVEKSSLVFNEEVEYNSKEIRDNRKKKK